DRPERRHADDARAAEPAEPAESPPSGLGPELRRGHVLGRAGRSCHGFPRRRVARCPRTSRNHRRSGPGPRLALATPAPPCEPLDSGCVLRLRAWRLPRPPSRAAARRRTAVVQAGICPTRRPPGRRWSPRWSTRPTATRKIGWRTTRPATTRTGI